MDESRRLLGKMLALYGLLLGALPLACGGSFSTDFNSGLPAGTHIYGGTRPDGVSPYPAIEDGVLKLTYAGENSEQGSFVVDDLDSGQQIGSFIAKFKLQIGGGTGADGVSFNFAPDLPAGPFGEEGAGSGFTVEFDTFDNGGGEAPAVDIKRGGVEVLHKQVSNSFLRTDKFVDVQIEAKSDGTIDVSYGTNVLYTNVFAYVPTSGQFGFGARTGGSTENHWVDDLSITTVPLAAPYVQKIWPSGDNASAYPTIQIELQDFNTQVDPSTVALKFDGADVTATTAKDAGTTTVTYTPPDFLPAGSFHTIDLSYQDSAGKPGKAVSSFTVANYSLVPADAALSLSDVDTSQPGFRVRPVQARSDAHLVNSLARADAQLAGTLIDPTTQQPYENKAIPGPNPDGSYNETEVVEYYTSGFPFPGIPGVEGSTDSCAEDITTYLQLDKGFYVFDVNSDDGFSLTAGSNPRDAFATVLGKWDGARSGGGDSVFSFAIQKSGVYPFRLVWENGAGDGSLAWYSIKQDDGTQVLINDSFDPSSIKAYRALKTTPTVPAYVLSVSPQAGAGNVSRRAPLKVVLLDDGTQVDPQSVKLSLDGKEVNATVAKDGKQTVVTYQPPEAFDSQSTHQASLSFSDNGSPATTRTQDWSFTTARSIQVTGQWDFTQGDLQATIGKALQYGDAAGETYMKDHTSFGTTTSFGIPDIGGKPANVMKYTRGDNPPAPVGPRGYLCEHGMNPNGGGTKVNQFTMIMDVMIPDLHQGDGYNSLVKWESIDDFSVDGSIFVKANDIGGPNTGGLGISGQYDGDGTTSVQGGKWQRIAVAVDMAAATPSITYYVDGVRFGQMTSGDRWGFDQRHAIPPVIRLFSDGGGDNEVNTLYVSSIQFRDGTMSAAEIAALGPPSASGIPYPGYVGGQWDFDQGDLRATVGTDLQYGDAPGETAMQDHTSFGSTTSFGIPDIAGQPAQVMKYTRDENPPTPIGPRGYICSHGLIPNGGGTKVNQFTMIVDLMIPDLHQGDGYNTVVKWEAVDDFSVDGSISIKANDIGGANTGGIGISGQYTGDGTTWIQGGKWQRVAVAVDMAASPPSITYYIDGVRFGQMTSGDRWGFDQRHAMPPVIRLFADGGGDNEVNTFYVNSIQFRDGALTDAQAASLGAASADGIPLVLPGSTPPEVTQPTLTTAVSNNSLTLSWDAAATGFTLESTDDLTHPNWTPVSGVSNNSVTITIGSGSRFYRLKQ